MSSEWWGVIIAGLVLFLGLIAHVVSTVWWASRTTTLLEATQSSILAMSTALKEMTQEIKSFGSEYIRKEDAIREIALINKQLETMWTKYEKLKDDTEAKVELLERSIVKRS